MGAGQSSPPNDRLAAVVRTVVRPVLPAIAVVLAGCGSGSDPARSTSSEPSADEPQLCETALHAWQSVDHPTADGLPMSGTATEAVADLVLERDGQVLIAAYDASSAVVVIEAGAAWVGQQGGAVDVIAEDIAVIQLDLDDSDACPAAPAFYNGVPLSFVISPHE